MSIESYYFRLYYKYKLFKVIYSNFVISFKHKAFYEIFFEKIVHNDGHFFKLKQTIVSKKFIIYNKK